MSIEDIRRVDYQRSYNWRVIITGEGEGMTFRASRITIPLTFLESEGWVKQNTREYYPTLNDIGEITIEFKEDEKGTVRKFIFGWRKVMMNDDGTYNYPDEYKKTVMVEFLKRDGTVATKYELHGCFPKNPADMDLDYAASEVLLMSCTFSVDYVVIEL